MGKSWINRLLVLLMWNCIGAQYVEDALPFQFTHFFYNAMIYENSPAKTFVESTAKMGIFMTNQSWDIRYEIENHENLFKAENYVLGDFCFLRIRTKGGNLATLNRELEDHYLLTINAIERQTGAETRAKVEVRVLDTNDLRPLFSPTTYSFFVHESSPIRTSIGKVFATDADIGTNGEYYFSLKDHTDMFSIHPTSGVIILTGKLDYSEAALYEMDVLAADRRLKLYGSSSSSSSSTAKLKVHVLHANEHAPVITAVPLTPLNRIKDQTYAYVTVEDCDEGQNGEIASLSIVAGDPLQQFKTFRRRPGSKQYEIRAIKEVEWEGYRFGYNLTLQAKDKGNPPKFSSAVVVRLRSPNENWENTTFEKSIYRVTINEFSPPHSTVILVRVVPKNPKIKYLIQHKMQTHENPFVINPNTGLITTAGLLKAERVSQYEFEVVTSDRRASTKVVVNVSDTNSYAPKFHQSYYEASIDEHVPIGTSILTVSASDGDDGENGYVTYSIANVNKQPFMVDYFTGVISTTENFDYETMPSKFSLRVRASDWGFPFRREAEVVVSITLTNLNDNKPQFENIDCNVAVPRSLRVGEQIIAVSAIDADDLGVVQYRIDAGNNMNLFELDSSSGVLTLKKSLKHGDAAKRSFHSLQISASDGERSSTPLFLNVTVVSAFKQIRSECVETGALRSLTGLLIFNFKLHSQRESDDEFADIHSVNRNTPRFIKSTPILIKVKEDLPVGTGILLLRAEDSDSGFNGKLLFVISGGNFDSCFTIEPDTGWLKVYEPLDRETTDHYTLNITVYDLGLPQKSSSHMLNINVLDANDNSPQFLQHEYSVTIREDTVVGTDIIQLEAKDEDLGVNGMVAYSVMTKTDKFVINKETGIVTVTSPLDRETNPSFVLKVAAFDHAINESKMLSTVLLHVHLEDVNDNAPRCIPQQYHVRLREDIPVGTLVIWLEAYDPDLGSSGQVRYSLTDGENESFQVDKLTGALYLSRALDFETRQVYNLTAKVKDRGKPNSLSSSCFIQVEVVDVNENLNRPFFPFFVDRGAVSEDAPVGSSVMKVTAHDKDSGRNGDVRYSIRDGSGLGVFTIDEESGVIRTQEILDRETTSYYWLTVYATDQGIVPLSSFVEVYVEVQDVNDNAPLTSEPIYYASVSENSPKDVSVIQIQAFDPDSTTSDNLSFQITSGNPQGFFAINPQTGLVTTTSWKLDREKQAEHILEITVSDDGHPPKSTVVHVIVKVLDENDNSPQFLEKIFQIKLVERAEAAEWEPIYRVIAYDRDESPSSDITYTIEETEEHRKFFIQPKSGSVFSKETFSAGEDHILTIKASDNGQPSRSSICRLHIEWIPKPKLAKQALVFEETSLSFSVMQSDPVARMIGVISTRPLESPVWFTIKGDAHAKEMFHILQMACDLNGTSGGNSDSRFDMERSSGTIIIAGALDAKRQSNYHLTIEATDGTRSISTQVIIQVINTNEHRPQFGQNRYEINIPEETQPGMKILEINATDGDEKNKLYYTLLSSTDLISLKKFRLDPETGFLYTAEQLDHETMHKHILTVMVSDQGFPVKSNFVKVIINIEDNNDNPPQFTSPQYTARVLENAAIGSSVLQVTALDKDKGLNAEILYSLDSGNHGNSFSIDQFSGIVAVAIKLDHEYRDQYVLQIKASDRGEPSLSAVTVVQITVTISDNTKPKFPFNLISAEVSESVPVGSFVTLVSASSQSTIFYQIKEGNVNGAFVINPNYGTIVTKEKLDYETLSSYTLIVQGTDMAGMSSSVTVNILLKDENDNAPVFTQFEFTGFISESATVGSVVLTSQNAPLVVLATDADKHINARLVYEIIEPFAHNYFSIDSETGAITSLSSLDYEQRKMFNFRVQVHDTGTPRLFAKNNANVTIHVINVNDCAPKFSQELYEMTIVLPTYKGVKVITLSSTDEDSLLYTKLRFALVDGNIGNKFLLDPNAGDIFVRNATQLRSRYRLTVQVSDGLFTGSAIVKLTVKADRDKQLRFTQEMFTAYVQESSTQRKTLAILSVNGSRINEPLFFSILNPDVRFEIGGTSGVLFSTGVPFDREEQDLFDIFVEVTKEQRLNGTAQVLVRVHVEDVNDNAPVFVDQPYSAIVQIGKAVGTVFKKVTAVDKDIGRNAHVLYYLKGHSKYFQVNSSGEISLKRPLELESIGKFVINITAQDGGDPPLISNAEVVISVVNKAVPMFERPFYKIEIPENLQIHTSILQVVANETEGPCTVYIISGGDPFHQFSINFNSGLIEVIQALDYESHPAYRLTIQATDCLTGTHSDVFVDVILKDVNDNRPKFEAAIYDISISESVVIGTSVLRVLATDSDTGSNALLFYQMYEKDGSISDHFRIDEESGVIQTAGPLDYETRSQHDLIVKAVDSGAFQLSSEVLVVIYITDINDNPPVFTQELYNATIREISFPGQFVTCVKAYDVDSLANGQLKYSIMSGNDDNVFDIDATTGEIAIASISRQSGESVYSLIVSVTDGVFRHNAEVKIYVMGENNHNPSFSQDEYLIELTENSPVGTLVMQVEAFDKDPGIYGQLTFFIVNDTARDTFTVNADGQIYTKESLDREKLKEKMMYISLMAKDGGGRLGFCTVVVILSYINDSSPKFLLSEYKVTVPADVQKGTTVITVSAVDEDEGSNANIIYIIDSDIGPFEIHSLTGAIVTKESLIGLENGLYSFFVKAKDSGDPPKQSITPVSIRILPPETSSPKFIEPSLWLELSEDLPVGTEIDIFQAKDERTVIYSLVGGNTLENNKDDVFTIDSNTGRLRLTKRLDYEATKLYQLSVQLQNFKESMETVSLINVSIHLKDVNDNSPQFKSITYRSYIAENLPEGTSVVQVKATDLDSWLNGWVTYRLHENQESPEVLEMFAVDSEAGWITTLKEVDREKRERYRITVVATDRAHDRQMTGTTVVEVTVVDINDNPPLFTEAVFEGTVREDQSIPDTVVSILSSVDSDSEEVNRRFSCFITGGDSQGQFDLKYTDGVWAVVVKKTLDREERDFYLLNITATDGTFVTKAAVEITVLDANDNSPVFEKNLYVETVSEDVPAGQQILQVSATDADIESNADITYQLSGNGAESFTIDSKTGAISTLANLDREMTDVYNLTVHAVDRGGHFCRADVVIMINDVNDNAPKFTSDPHHVSVFENTQPGTYVARLQAFDGDAGINGKIRYSFEDSAGGLFSIEGSSGIISLERTLDRQKAASHVLRVRATDHGSPHRLSSLTSVLVTVLNANDHPPAFEHRNYISTVPEDVAIGTKLLNVFAASRDGELISKTNVISYYITSGNENGAFSINSQTGDIFVMGPLDYEVSPQHYLTVMAISRGKQSLSDMATVTVHLLDVNDNSPEFSQNIYSSTVSEDTGPGSTVLMVLANDFDGPSNNRIRFSIKDNNEMCPFVIDADSGELRVTQQLDREKIASYMLTVLASDNGNPTKSSSATIKIIVSDVNDNPPVFSQNNYSIIIQENLPTGATVLLLNVTDNDSPHNGPPFSFCIVKGDQTSPFSIDQQGVIKTSGQLRKGHHVLQVQVSDNGSPPLKSVAAVNMLVVQASVYPPSVTPLDVFIMVQEDEYSEGILGRVHATDKDKYDTLTFSLEPQSSSLFTVGATDGRLLAHGGLDVGHYQLNVSVSDGRFSSLARVTVRVRQVTPQMLDSSVSVRFAGVTAEVFIQDHWKSFQRAVRSLAGVHRGDVQLISLQPAQTSGGLDVLLFFEKLRRSGTSSLEALVQKLNSSREAIRKMTGVCVLRVLRLNFPDGKCRRVVLLDQTSMATYSTAIVSYVIPRHNITAECLCTDKKCSKHKTSCLNKPCPGGNECLSGVGEDEHSCICTGDAEGKCSGESSMTFTENSYINYHIRESRRELKLTLRLKTLSREGTVMFTRGRSHSILQIVGGRLQFQFDCGLGLATVSVHSIPVNDGQWHVAELEVKRNYARLVLDKLHSASGIAPGPLHCLSLGNQVVLGGYAHLLSARLGLGLPDSNGLQGCMDSVVFNGQRLALNSSGLSGVSIENMVGVSPGCVFSSSDCSSNPCLNGGSCIKRQNGGYFCKCSLLFSGTHCEVNISPCDSNPCLYGGTCIQNNLDYYCKCRGQYSGQRCHIAPYCKENPCQNGGLCIDSLDGPICECKQGFKGERCVIDVDECVDRPCFNNGRCINMHGSFNCSCLAGFAGRLCETDIEVKNFITSTSWNSRLGELLGTLAFLTAIFALTLLLLVVWKGACNPAKRHQSPDKYKAVDSYIQMSDDNNQTRKRSCVDIPPQVPVRPVSYTPSVPGECRNNQDSTFDFSSYMPDPLIDLKKTLAVSSVAPNIPRIKAFHHHSQNYSIHQAEEDDVKDDIISCLHDSREMRSVSSLEADITNDNASRLMNLVRK